MVQSGILPLLDLIPGWTGNGKSFTFSLFPKSLADGLLLLLYSYYCPIRLATTGGFLRWILGKPATCTK